MLSFRIAGLGNNSSKMPCKPVNFFKKKKLFPFKEIYKLAQVLPVKKLFQKHSILHIHKNKKDIPQIEHDHFTRQATQVPLKNILTKSAFIQKQTKYIGIQYYNKISTDLKKNSSPSLFKKELHKYLLNNLTS